ncbi:hypothetical protein GQ55_6G073600 [Panicum hallii var. hallii]|uniref:MATH domain-containing protein n=1 Tax=Panicum hallii var. hallii TaxID=1504633 RepID=A0A2T7D4W2_9POAL|nr:hypothetical protein GQ55_6G073600 [Panicum hallii var. hallii]
MPPSRRFFRLWPSSASSSPRHAATPTTVSTSTPETAQGRHVFEINGYSKHRGMGHDKFVRSGTFSVGGHSWSIRFYPDGYGKKRRLHLSLSRAHEGRRQISAGVLLPEPDQLEHWVAIFGAQDRAEDVQLR